MLKVLSHFILLCCDNYGTDLILWCVVESRVAALGVAVVQQVVVDQVPAPAVRVGAEQRQVAVTLEAGFAGGHADHGHSAQRALPHHLPGVPAVTEAALPPRCVRALRHWVTVQCEAVGLDVDVAGAVGRVPRMAEGAQLGLIGWH